MIMWYILGERLSFKWTAANRFERGTRGELHHSQTPTLDRSAVWTKLCCSHKYDQSISRFFQPNFWQIFAILTVRHAARAHSEHQVLNESTQSKP